jgi:dTDP-4-dehydrorhamnose 3,5-epimerase
MGWSVYRPYPHGNGAALIFEPAALSGVVIVSPDRHTDDRGFFARTWCAREFAAAGLPSRLAQSSVSWNHRKHTLRGMHWESRSQQESKLVRCTHGAIFDVVVDLRPESPSYLEHVGMRLGADDHRALFIPPGMAHGFLTLADETEVFYQMNSFYVPEAEHGARWDDPTFDIDWPAAPAVISKRDSRFPDFAVDLMAEGTQCKR